MRQTCIFRNQTCSLPNQHNRLHNTCIQCSSHFYLMMTPLLSVDGENDGNYTLIAMLWSRSAKMTTKILIGNHKRHLEAFLRRRCRFSGICSCSMCICHLRCTSLPFPFSFARNPLALTTRAHYTRRRCKSESKTTGSTRHAATTSVMRSGLEWIAVRTPETA